MEDRQYIYIYISVVFGFLLSFAYFFLTSKKPFSEFSNIVVYIIGVIIFVISSIAMFLVFRKDLACSRKIVNVAIEKEKQNAILLLVFAIGWGIAIYVTEGNYNYSEWLKITQIRHCIPGIMYAILLGVVTFATIRIVKGYYRVNFGRYYRLIFSISVSLLQTWQLYAPNFLEGHETTSYHIHAYTNSIVNVSRLIPFSEEVNCIYGHYAIFYVLPVKLLHVFIPNKWICINLVIMSVGLLVNLLFSYVLHYVLKSDVIYTISLISLMYLYYASTPYVYYQLYPHRLLGMAGTLAGIVWIQKIGMSRKRRILLWCMIALLAVWNFETAMVCGLSWTIFRCVVQLSSEEKVNVLSCIACLFKESLWLSLSFVSGYLIFNGYNLIAGGEVASFRTYLYPLFQKLPNAEGTPSNSFIETLQMSIPLPFESYFLVITILSCVTVYCILFYIAKRKIVEKYLVMFISTIMGLGMFTYAMNITGSGIRYQIIAGFPMVLILAIIVEDSLLGEYFFRRDNILSIKAIVVGALYVVLVALCMGTLANGMVSIDKQHYTIKDKGRIDKLAEWVNSSLPEDVVGFGECVPELFAYMNRSTGMYLMDWSDMNAITSDFAKNEIVQLNSKYIFARDKQADYIPSTYEKIDGYTLGDAVFALYEKER